MKDVRCTLPLMYGYSPKCFWGSRKELMHQHVIDALCTCNDSPIIYCTCAVLLLADVATRWGE